MKRRGREERISSRVGKQRGAKRRALETEGF
jgi:hypothetical protein